VRRKKLCDTCAALAERIRLQVRARVSGKKYDAAIRRALRGQYKTSTLSDRLGYSTAELRKHIERCFKPGMTWSAFHKGDIHIDHIIPLKTFDLTDQSQVRSAYALTNLQPMWAKDNIAKGGKVLTLI
jgi:5-methylcytosine-specific restriction endonuclease McrA